jgi:hypothetical protein
MGSFRFRRSVKIAPGLRLNLNKRSVGLSAGARGVRYSINSSGRRARSVGIPGSGLSYRSQSGGAPHPAAVPSTVVSSPTRRVARLVAWLTVAALFFAVLDGHPHFGGTVAAIGILVYLGLRVLRGALDPLIGWLLTHAASSK